MSSIAGSMSTCPSTEPSSSIAVFFKARLPVFFFWPKEIMSQPPSEPWSKELYPGTNNLRHLPRPKGYVDMEFVTSFKFETFSKQKKGETLEEFGRRRQEASEKLDKTANPGMRQKAQQKLNASRTNTGEWKWTKDCKVYVWDPVPFPPFHFRRLITKSEAKSTLSKYPKNQYQCWHQSQSSSAC